MRTLLAVCILLATSGAALAEPWRLESYTINPGTFHSAAQFDSSGDYVMVVQCHQETGVFELYVESPYDWDFEASYAPEVPAVLGVGGVDVADVMFYFDDKQMGEGIRADNTGEAFGRLLDRLASATDPITLNYFERSATFSAEGIHHALMSLASSCGR